MADTRETSHEDPNSLAARRANVWANTKIGEVSPMAANDPAYNNSAFSGGGTSQGSGYVDPNAKMDVQDDVFGPNIKPTYATATTGATTATGTTGSQKEDVGLGMTGAGNTTTQKSLGLAAPVLPETTPSTNLAVPKMSMYGTTGATNQEAAGAQGSVSTGDTMASLLDENSKYLQAARAGGLQEGAKRGLLNSSMSAEAGELAAIKAAAPLAQQDAGYWQSRGLAEQKSGLDIQGYHVQGDISSRLQAEKAEYDRILSKQNAGQELTLQDRQYLLDYTSKSLLSSQAAAQDIYQLKTKADIDAYLMSHQGQINSLLSAQEAGQTLTAQQQKAIDDYNTASALQQQEAYQTQQLELIKQQGANQRQSAELSAQKEIEQMNISAQEKEIVSNAMITLGTELDAQVSAISQNTNIPADAKAAMIAQQYELYYSNVNMALAAYGIRIEWEDL